MTSEVSRPWLVLTAVLAALLAWRLLAGLDAQLNLSIDEAQYFLWSLEPAWGYFSKPPLIAWTIAASTGVCGESETCIRLPALLLFAASAWIVASLTRKLFDARTGMWAGIAFASLFLSSFYSWVMTTDSILLFLWSLSLLLFLRALDSDRWTDWLALGIAAGLGLLAKYSMGLFLGCALLVLWLDHRPRLASPKPWAAALLALSFLIPNILWNVSHQFATLRHTAEISQLHRQLFHPESLSSFILAQFGVMGPLMLPALLVAASDRQTWRNDPRHRLLALFSLPVLGLFVVLSLLSRAHANWAAPAYAAATVLAVTTLLRRGHRQWLLWAVIVNLILAAGLYHWHRIAPAIGLELRKGSDPFHPLRGWDVTGRQLAEQLHASDCKAIIAGDRATLVELTYYARRALGSQVISLAYNPEGRIRNHFELTADIASRKFDCAILIGNFDSARMHAEFASAERLAGITVPGANTQLQTWRVSGFSGYSSGRDAAGL